MLNFGCSVLQIHDKYLDALIENLNRRFEGSSVLLSYRAFEPAGDVDEPIMTDDIEVR